MASTTTTRRLIESALQNTEDMLDDLPELAEEWPDLTEGERASWGLEWDHAMVEMRSILEPAYSGGTMTAEQQCRYALIKDRLRDLLPRLRQLSLTLPLIPLA